MNQLTHRERAIRTFKHQPTDRVPMDMMGNATMLLDKTYLRLRDYFGLAPIPAFRSGSTANYYDERILEIFDIDFRRVWLRPNPQATNQDLNDGTYRDAWGVRNSTDGMFVNALDHPLQKAIKPAEVLAYPWPTAEQLFSTEGLHEEAQRRFKKTDFALVARNPITFGLLDRACAMMGTSELMIAMTENPAVVEALFAKLLEIFKSIYGMLLDNVGSYVQMVEYGDDLGSQSNLLISPAMYRRFIKPMEKDLCRLIRNKAPQAAIFRHTDGSIFRIIPDLIEVGFQVLNPVQTSSQGMNGIILKSTYGDVITFHGAIEKLEATPEELEAEVNEKMEIFKPGGGYVFSSCNHMIDVPIENILLMFETARKTGFYQE